MEHNGKILLVENQYLQFKKVAFMLRSERFEVFPTGRKYISFINDVRIFLNERYGPLDKPGKRATAYTNIVAALAGIKPDIFIIDQVLVGHHKALDGIHLVEKLRSIYKEQPVIFLSRTANNDEHVMESLPKIGQPHVWINKGYFGEEILNKEYFDKYVLAKVKKLILNGFNSDIENLIHKMIYEKQYSLSASDHLLHEVFIERLKKYKAERYLSPNDANQLNLINMEAQLSAKELNIFIEAIDQNDHE